MDDWLGQRRTVFECESGLVAIGSLLGQNDLFSRQVVEEIKHIGLRHYELVGLLE